MAKQIEWPAEDIVMEICWNGDPDRCSVIPREFLPDPCCYNCMKRKECDPEDDDNVCEKYEWDENTEDLRDEPKEPRREDYLTEQAYMMAKKAVREWWVQYSPDK
jgi:hypothetical protein